MQTVRRPVVRSMAKLDARAAEVEAARGAAAAAALRALHPGGMPEQERQTDARCRQVEGLLGHVEGVEVGRFLGHDDVCTEVHVRAADVHQRDAVAAGLVEEHGFEVVGEAAGGWLRLVHPDLCDGGVAPRARRG